MNVRISFKKAFILKNLARICRSVFLGAQTQTKSLSEIQQLCFKLKVAYLNCLLLVWIVPICFFKKQFFSKAIAYSTDALKLNHVDLKCTLVQIEKHFTISRNSPKKITVTWSVKVCFCSKTFITKVSVTLYVRLYPNIKVFLLQGNNL